MAIIVIIWYGTSLEHEILLPYAVSVCVFVYTPFFVIPNEIEQKIHRLKTIYEWPHQHSMRNVIGEKKSITFTFNFFFRFLFTWFHWTLCLTMTAILFEIETIKWYFGCGTCTFIFVWNTLHRPIYKKEI